MTAIGIAASPLLSVEGLEVRFGNHAPALRGVEDVYKRQIHGAFSDALPDCIVKYIPLHTPAVVMSFSSILADINAKNRPGAGFVPIPALSLIHI